ncbi:MAG: SsrA-binding protein SmpB [Candidatus Omnitrophica bacterium]|nr:SsrA-binding protein SmpB [Candidatus Omnitrophota bacterium]
MATKKEKENPNNKQVASNRQAYHSYEMLEKAEAGLKLLGTEVKSLRDGRCSLKEGYARFDGQELFLHDVHIPPYDKGNVHNHEPVRPRKLLMHKSELKRFYGLLTQKGLTIIPLSLYFKRGKAKVEIGIAKTKKLHDRRQDIKNKITAREVDRAIKNSKKG